MKACAIHAFSWHHRGGGGVAARGTVAVARRQRGGAWDCSGGAVAVAARGIVALVAAAYGGKTETGPFQPSFM